MSAAMGSLINARPPWGSLVTQRLDGAEARGPVRGIETEEQADANRNAEGHEDRGHRDDRCRQAGDGEGENAGQSEADQDSKGPTQSREKHRLDQELHQDVAPPGADRLADADLAGAFRDGDQHDVHDPDAADDQGNAGDRAQHQGEDAGRLRGAVQHVLLAEDLKISLGGVRDVMPVQQHLRDLGGRGIRRLGARRLDVDLLHVAAAAAEEVVPCRGDGYQHHVILVVEATRRTLLGEDTDHAEALPVDLDHLANRVLVVEQVGDHRLADDGDFAGGVDVGRGEELPTGQLVVANRGKILRGTGQAAVPVLVAESHLGPSAGARYRGYDVRRSLAVGDRLDIIQGQRRAGAKALLDAAGASRVGGEAGEQVRPERLNL